MEQVIAQAASADAAGIAAICLTEHHLGGFNTYGDPFVMGAHLAAYLRRAHLAIHVVQVPLRHPVRIAEQANALDLLTRGRFMLGLSSGAARPIEFAAFGVDVEARSRLAEQGIEALVAALRWRDGDPPLELRTDHTLGVLSARLSPASFRRPHPLLARATKTEATIVSTGKRSWPVLLGVHGNPAADRRAVKLYRNALEQSECSAESAAECTAWLGFLTTVSVAPTESAARERIERYLAEGGSGPILEDANAVAPAGVRALAKAREDWYARQQVRGRGAIAGTPEMIVERLRADRGLGVNHVRVSLISTSRSEEENAESFRLFVEEVVPHLDPEPLPEPLPGPAPQPDSVPGPSMTTTTDARRTVTRDA